MKVFNIYQDFDGSALVLVRPLASFWLAVKFARKITLVLLSKQNLDRLNFIGTATWEA